MSTSNYELNSEKSPGLNVKNCPYCSHRIVCAVYDAFMDADIKASDFNILSPGCDDRIYEVIAAFCSQFTW